MSKKTLYVLGMLITIILTCFLQWKYCCNCNKSTCEKENTTSTSIQKPEIKQVTKMPFVISDSDGSLSLKGNDNFNFKNGQFSFLTPVSPDLEANIFKIKDYLASNEGKSLSITGLFTNDEENTSIYPNLGIARANSVKNYFVGKGIPSKWMDTFGKLESTMVSDSTNVYFGPVQFSIAKQKDETEELAALQADLKANPLVLNFRSGQTKINLSPEQRTRLSKLSHYLDKVEDAVCITEGHTDNTGDASKNMVYGQQRADFAKQLLVKNGISASKIEAISKGQTEPIADNTTEEGKAKNRRTIIRIK